MSDGSVTGTTKTKGNISVKSEKPSKGAKERAIKFAEDNSGRLMTQSEFDKYFNDLKTFIKEESKESNVPKNPVAKKKYEKNLVDIIVKRSNEIQPDNKFLSKMQKLLHPEKEPIELPSKEIEAEVGAKPEQMIIKSNLGSWKEYLDEYKKDKNSVNWQEWLSNTQVPKQDKLNFINSIITDKNNNQIVFGHGLLNEKDLTIDKTQKIIKNLKNPAIYEKHKVSFIDDKNKLTTRLQMEDAFKEAGHPVINLLDNQNQAKQLKEYLSKLPSTIEEFLSEESKITREKPERKALKVMGSPKKLKENEKLNEQIKNILSDAEKKLEKNYLEPRAIDELKNKATFKKATTSEKNQMIINKIGGLAKKSDDYKEEVDKLYSKAFPKFSTKKEVLKELNRPIYKIKPASRISEIDEEIKNLRTNKAGKYKPILSKVDQKKFDSLVKEKEDIPKILEDVGKNLGDVEAFAKIEEKPYTTPEVRVSPEKAEEIKKEKVGQALKVLPEEVELKKVFIPSPKEELTKLKKQLEAEKQPEEIKKIKEQIKLQQGFERGRRKMKIVPLDTETKQQGTFRPFYPNVTEENVLKYNILDTLQEENEAIRNFNIFDIPDDNTGGIGTAKTNILLKQNKDEYDRNHSGTLNDFVTWDNYAQAKSFWNPVPIVDMSDVPEYKFEKDLEMEWLVEDKLKKYNKDENGFINQYEVKEETEIKRNIYVPPSNFIKPTPYSNFAYVLNQDMLETEFLSNVNYFMNK